MVCKTVKKGLVGAGLGALALYVLFGTSAPSYVKTAFSWARQGAKDSVPIDFEIKRVQQVIADLEPKIHDRIELLENEKVEVERQERELVAFQKNLDREAKEMVALNESLKSGRDVLTTGGSSYTAEEIRADLARRLASYRRGKELLNSKEQTLKVRQQNVQAIKQTLDEMVAQKKDLTTKVEAIKARLLQIEATQASNKFNFDDSELSSVKQTVDELDRRVEVMARVAEQEGRYSEKLIPVPVGPSPDVSKEIEAEFGAPHHSADKSL